MRQFIALPLCWALCIAAAPGLAAAASPVAGEGLKIDADMGDDWSPWQARLALGPPARPLFGSAIGMSPNGNALLAGDRYLGWGRVGDGGGLRATGALLLGPGALALAAPAGVSHGEMQWRGTNSPSLADPEANAPMPYLGLGYSAWWARSGLGVSADLGLAAQRPGQVVRFGRAMQGSEGLDDVIKAMQLAPMFQVNLSYTF
jgi:hypothetical protein